MQVITDMETWMLDFSDRIYRFQVYKKLFTPYEQSMKFMDETQFEDNQYRIGYIKEAIDLGNGKWILGFREIIDGDVCEYISYFRFDDIQLSCFDSDQHMWDDEEEE